MKVEAIFGPPGTGKTSELVRIAGEEAKRIKAGSVLYLSYTKAAAAEATSRVKDERIKPSTLHSLAFNEIGMNRAGVVDAYKMRAFAQVTGIPFKGSEAGSDEPQEGDEYATVLEFSHNAIIDPLDAWDRFGKPGTQVRFENFCASYQSWKQTSGYMDFDDMLAKFSQQVMLKRAAPVIILDEAQDCTPLQWMAFIRICENAQRVYIAGDDDQAIYEWSGANPRGMADFAEVHEGQVRVLDQSYRVPLSTYLKSQAVIGEVGNRVPKVFKPAPRPGSVARIGDFWNIDLGRDVEGGALVLCRDQWRRQEIQKELNRELIPYDVLGGSSPWTNKIAESLRKGEKVEIPLHWREFYAQADLNQKPGIIISTVHQAKGREHHTVIVDLSCPARVLHNYALNPDAERRVWYVALTRTSERMLLCGENPVL